MGSRERALAILIVEDRAVIASHIEDVVKRIGGGFVGCAGRISDALNILETTSWDAALLDLLLAHEEMAYPVAERLRAQGVPFAFVTAWEGEIESAYQDVPVLRKPFGEADLEDCLRALISQVPQPTVAQQAA